jgi:hypothetical protein
MRKWTTAFQGEGTEQGREERMKIWHSGLSGEGNGWEKTPNDEEASWRVLE